MAELSYPAELKFAKSDEWIRVDGDTATMGISDYAKDSLGDISFIQLNEAGESLSKGDVFGELESVKAASELYLPVDGEILEVNSALEDDLEVINSDPYGAGWLIKIKITDDAGLADLMDAETYKAYCESR